MYGPFKEFAEANPLPKDGVKLQQTLSEKGTLMFPTVEGNLQRTNPAQRDLPGIKLAGENAA